MANNSLQPMPVWRLSSAFAVDITASAWLSSGRLDTLAPMSQARHSQPNLLLDFVIVIVAAALLVLASSFGLQARHPATKGAGAVCGGLYIVYLGVLFLLSYFFCRACYVFTFLQFVCTSCSCPRGRHMALFYFFLGLVVGSCLLLVGLGIL